MPSVRGFWKKRGRGGKYWYCRHPVTNRQVSTRCQDLTAAKLWRTTEERTAADPAHRTKASAHTYRLEAVAEALLDERELAGKSAATLEVYACKLSHLVRELGADTDVRKLTREHLTAYIAERTKIRPNGKPDAGRHTVHKELRALKLALKTARVSTDCIPQYADGYEPRSTYLTKDQFRRLHVALPEHRRLDVLFLVLTGARLSEYQRASRADIRGQVVWLRGTKTKHAARAVPLAPELAAAIAAADPSRKGPMFAPWASLQRDIKAACGEKRANCPRVSPNDLRRTYCTWLRDAGVDEATCASLLGHTSSLMVRKVYGQTTDTRKQLAIAALGSVFGVAGTATRSATTTTANDRSIRAKKAVSRR